MLARCPNDLRVLGVKQRIVESKLHGWTLHGRHPGRSLEVTLGVDASGHGILFIAFAMARLAVPSCLLLATVDCINSLKLSTTSATPVRLPSRFFQQRAPTPVMRKWTDDHEWDGPKWDMWLPISVDASRGRKLAAAASEAAEAAEAAQRTASDAAARAASQVTLAEEVRLEAQQTAGSSGVASNLTAAIEAIDASVAQASRVASAAAAFEAELAQEAALAARALAALRAAERQQLVLQDLEDELLVEIKTAGRFLWRGQGLLDDFRKSSPGRRKNLLRGVMDNYVSVHEALVNAEAAGATTQAVLDEANEIADQLAEAREEMMREDNLSVSK